MEIATGILLAATIIGAARNLYKLTFILDDDPAKQRRMKFKTSGFDRNSQATHYFLTIQGGRIIEAEPID